MFDLNKMAKEEKLNYFNKNLGLEFYEDSEEQLFHCTNYGFGLGSWPKFLWHDFLECYFFHYFKEGKPFYVGSEKPPFSRIPILNNLPPQKKQYEELVQTLIENTDHELIQSEPLVIHHEPDFRPILQNNIYHSSLLYFVRFPPGLLRYFSIEICHVFLELCLQYAGSFGISNRFTKDSIEHESCFYRLEIAKDLVRRESIQNVDWSLNPKGIRMWRSCLLTSHEKTLMADHPLSSEGRVFSTLLAKFSAINMSLVDLIPYLSMRKVFNPFQDCEEEQFKESAYWKCNSLFLGRLQHLCGLWLTCGARTVNLLLDNQMPFYDKPSLDVAYDYYTSGGGSV